MQFEGDGEWSRAENTKRIKRFLDFIPGHRDFSPCHRNKFVQNLHAKHAARSEEFLGSPAAMIVLCYRVNQYVRIEE
jgi:hypothetical protein